MKLLQLMLTVAVLTGTSLFAQKSKTNTNYSKHPPAGMHDFDWQGIYRGITSCANCDGLDTELVLKKGNKYTLTIQAINVENEPFVSEGTFKWQGDIIHLQGQGLERTASRYKISDTEAKQLYEWDNKLHGENWTEYTLKKVEIVIIDFGRQQEEN